MQPRELHAMDVPAAKKPLYTSTVEVPPLAETKPGPSADDAFDPVVQEEKRLEDAGIAHTLFFNKENMKFYFKVS